MLKGIAIWLAAVNLMTYVMYWWDKRRAVKGKRRVSERELVAWALVGGTPAAFLAMRRFRHKTQKSSFRRLFWLIVAAQLAILWWLFPGSNLS